VGSFEGGEAGSWRAAIAASTGVGAAEPAAGVPQLRKALFLPAKTRYRPPAERRKSGCFGRVGATN
jgi:hypothetical protein